MRRIGTAALAVALALAACSSSDDEASSTTTSAAPGSTASPTSASVTTVARATSTDAAGEVEPEGFSGVLVRVAPPDGGNLLEWCLWLAATGQERERGLMGVTTLGAAPGMLFDFGTSTTGQFWMYQTLLPLSIAFYDDDGAFVSSTDMEPCTTSDTGACARYGAEGPYTLAIETAVGDLDRLGLVRGSRLEVGEACTPG